jgi:cytochrome c-type biogenesis protein CcmE
MRPETEFSNGVDRVKRRFILILIGLVVAAFQFLLMIHGMKNISLFVTTAFNLQNNS